MELFIGLYRKPLIKPTAKEVMILELVENSGPFNINRISGQHGSLYLGILHREYVNNSGS